MKTTVVLLVGAMILGGALTAPVRGDDTYWQHDPATPGDWFDPANWTNGGPAGFWLVGIDNGGTALISAGDASTTYQLYVGDANAGAIVQTGGSLDTHLRLGVQAGSTGRYELTGGLLDSYGTKIGLNGDGVFEQSGGEALFRGDYYNEASWHYIGTWTGSLGVCRLSGGVQTVSTQLVIAHSSGAEGLFELSGAGQLSVERLMTVGGRGTGRFVQSGGSVAVEYSSTPDDSTIYLGRETSGVGTYELSAGSVRTHALEIGQRSGGTGTFIQSGGTVEVTEVNLGPQGRYVYTAGQLQPAYSLISEGQFDFDHSAATLAVPAETLFDFGRGSVVNCANASIQAAANTLVVFPAGFDPSGDLAGLSSGGVVHVRGTTLVVPAGRGFMARGVIDDPVQCYGTVSWSGDYDDYLTLNGGLRVFPGAEIDVGPYGVVNVDDLDSGMTGGLLHSGVGTVAITEGNLRVGDAGTGRFEHTGGRNEADTVTLGHDSTGDGTYVLGGDGVLVTDKTYVGYWGTGRLVQDGGTHQADHIYLGYLPGSSGTYEMNGGVLHAGGRVGQMSTGRFLQTGGTVKAVSLGIGGTNATSDGAYEISGGVLQAGEMGVGSPGGARFTQTGGGVEVFVRLSVGDGTYNLADGTLTTDRTYVGREDTDGLFAQAGGVHQTRELIVYPTGRYDFTGGQLVVSKTLMGEGTFDLAGGAGEVIVGDGAFVDFRAGSLDNAGGASMTVGANSLAAFPAGFDPARDFGSYVSQGVTYLPGSPLVIPAGTDIVAYGTFEDQVECAGSLRDRDLKGVNLHGGLVLVGGTVDLARGQLRVEDETSGQTGGSLSIEQEDVGLWGTGRYVQDGGSNYVRTFNLGAETGSDGTYVLRGGGSFRGTNYVNVGRFGCGRFIQENGQVDIHSFTLASYGGSGLYEILDGQLTITGDFRVGKAGQATLRQTGGSVWSENQIILGYFDGARGDYEMSGGQMECTYLDVGWEGEGRFIQTGGLVTVRANGPWSGDVHIGNRGSGVGYYTLSGTGQLHAENLYVGMSGRGTFRQEGGSATISDAVFVTYGGGGSGTYELAGGSLTAGTCFIGSGGTFTQSGGQHNVATMWLGFVPGTSGRYVLSGGSLTVGRLNLGAQGDGTLELADPGGALSVSTLLYLGTNAALLASPGSAIHMTGAQLQNRSTRPAQLAGLGDLTMIFEGGPADVDRFEIASRDLGPVPAGLVENFALGGLRLGAADVGQVRLVNSFRNLPGAAAQYVDMLTVGPGCHLDLAGFPLYYRRGTIDPTATILGGQPIRIHRLLAVEAEDLPGTFAPTGGSHGLGTVTFAGTADLQVQLDVGGETYPDGWGYLTASLLEDRSEDGWAEGLFTDGLLLLRDQAGALLLSGAVTDLELIELAGDSAALSGHGVLEVTDGSLSPWFLEVEGNFVDLALDLDVPDIDGFSQSFTGVVHVTIRPIPEPAVLALLGLGAIGLIRRNRRPSPPRPRGRC